jgi:hypothetical protein
VNYFAPRCANSQEVMTSLWFIKRHFYSDAWLAFSWHFTFFPCLFFATYHFPHVFAGEPPMQMG